MFVKKFKRKCSVRGCKNTENVYVISKRREMGNTIAMCRDCMKEALASTENYVEPAKVKKQPKPLFPHPELDVTLSSVADAEEPKPEEVIEDVTEETHISVAEDTVTIDKEEEMPIPTPSSSSSSSSSSPKPKTTNTKKNTKKK